MIDRCLKYAYEFQHSIVISTFRNLHFFAIKKILFFGIRIFCIVFNKFSVTLHLNVRGESIVGIQFGNIMDNRLQLPLKIAPNDHRKQKKNNWLENFRVGYEVILKFVTQEMRFAVSFFFVFHFTAYFFNEFALFSGTQF